MIKLEYKFFRVNNLFNKSIESFDSYANNKIKFLNFRGIFGLEVMATLGIAKVLGSDLVRTSFFLTGSISFKKCFTWPVCLLMVFC